MNGGPFANSGSLTVRDAAVVSSAFIAGKVTVIVTSTNVLLIQR